ncbi:hypothetical protein A3B93_01805 [Candidatus Nomurabacteria bacterium RIFCSPHIGHO2_02_FULL_42_24]|uniref:DUF11 domain-containing protein n=1 Tax=Candidatus Nomurabacteria bacterium RIFCSPHIGHO2_02_FULL_42_24 TaxID=1801757 RepID=A0A1F6WH09_9BACT|nr:MAG: hypothetical protein A3B93_01805 [Candidatus Nomurabacteria bacterium RIFCSPHIGHO2_02_FULL_42_24]
MKKTFIYKNILLTGAIFMGLLAFVSLAQAVAPIINTLDATPVGPTYAVLNGSYDANGKSTSVWFQWGTDSSSFGSNTSSLNIGVGSSNYNKFISGLKPSTTYYFRLVGNNGDGTIYGSTLNFTTQSSTGGVTQQNNNTGTPTVTTSSASGINNSSAVLNGYINPNGNTMTRWFDWGTSSGSLTNSTSSGSQGSSTGNFSDTISNLSANTTYYFRAVGRTSGGQTYYGSTSSFQTANTNTSSLVPAAVTKLASSITETSAVMNGTAYTKSVATNGYFKYGTTSALNQTTSIKSLGSASTVDFSETLTGLEKGAIYYFQAVAQNAHGTSLGEVKILRTAGGGVTDDADTGTAVKSKTAINKVAGNSMIMLKIESDKEEVRTGENVAYTVTYKNITSRNLENSILQVLLPRGIEFGGATEGDFSQSENALTVDLDTLSMAEGGEVKLKGVIGRIEKNQDMLVVTARLVYTHPDSRAQEDAIAYYTHDINRLSSQGAAAAAGGYNKFMPDTLLEWLILILVIVGLIYFARKMYPSKNKNELKLKTVDPHFVA